MNEIMSLKNDLIKETVKLQQKKYRNEFILAEGKKAVEEAVLQNLKIKALFTSNIELCSKYQEFETYLVTEPIMKKISTTESPSNIVAVVKKPKYSIEIFKKFKKIALLDNIKDAGNLGTIIRAASAFNFEGIILTGDTIDEFSPKVIRSSAGNMFKIPIVKTTERELLKFKKTHKFIATVVNSNNSLESFKRENPIIVMFGSEANGLSDELAELSDIKLTIKMQNEVESLNLALSAGIVLYELQ